MDRPDQHASLYSAVERFSRKIENHTAAVALNYFVCNFIGIHRTLRTSPAMAVGGDIDALEESDLVGMLEAAEAKKAA